jgi:hypothetical protein
VENRSLRATGPAGGAGLGQWFAGAQQGDPVAMDGLLRAELPTRRFAAKSCDARGR